MYAKRSFGRSLGFVRHGCNKQRKKVKQEEAGNQKQNQLLPTANKSQMRRRRRRRGRRARGRWGVGKKRKENMWPWPSTSENDDDEKEGKKMKKGTQ